MKNDPGSPSSQGPAESKADVSKSQLPFSRLVFKAHASLSRSSQPNRSFHCFLSLGFSSLTFLSLNQRHENEDWKLRHNVILHVPEARRPCFIEILQNLRQIQRKRSASSSCSVSARFELAIRDSAAAFLGFSWRGSSLFQSAGCEVSAMPASQETNCCEAVFFSGLVLIFLDLFLYLLCFFDLSLQFLEFRCVIYTKRR